MTLKDAQGTARTNNDDDFSLKQGLNSVRAANAPNHPVMAKRDNMMLSQSTKFEKGSLQQVANNGLMKHSPRMQL